MKKVLVSGASGFIGGNVIEALRNNGITPVALLRNKSRSDFIKAFSPEIMLGDISDKESLKNAVRHVDGVVHCAGLTKAASLAEYLMINAEGTKTCSKRAFSTVPILKALYASEAFPLTDLVKTESPYTKMTHLHR